MAVSFKTEDGYGYSLLPLFGVAHGIIAMAKEYGVAVNQQGPGNFAVMFNGQSFGVIPIKGQAITLAKAGTLGPASKQAIQYQFEQALTKAIDHAKLKSVGASEVQTPNLGQLLKQKLKQSEEMPESLMATADSVGVSDVGFSPEYFGDKVQPQPMPKKKFTTGALAEMMKKTPVPLFKATNCGQPVKGTSHSSVYYVVARFNDMNLAIRAKGGRLSCRAEGKNLNYYLGALGELGFSGHDSYASVHYDIAEQALMMKTVGAIISRLGFNALEEVIDPLMVWGK